jgi:polyphosphate kinase 2
VIIRRLRIRATLGVLFGQQAENVVALGIGEARLLEALPKQLFRWRNFSIFPGVGAPDHRENIDGSWYIIDYSRRGAPPRPNCPCMKWDHHMALKKKADKPSKMKRKAYEKELRALQVELCHLQDWVKEKGARIIIAFEGRDAAGKGGTIKAITERVSPRVFRVVALPAPSDREKTQLFAQRYIERFPSAGEIIIFDRSWYNRAGVEYVMGFCSEEEHRVFLQIIPQIEKYVVDAGIRLIKIWLEVGKDEQERRFSARINDPLRQWKLSPMDLESYRRWYDYSRARDQMFGKTDSKHAPWYIVRSNDKRRARLNCIAHILKAIPYKKVRHEKVKLPRRSERGKYDDETSLKGRNFVPERY